MLKHGWILLCILLLAGVVTFTVLAGQSESPTIEYITAALAHQEAASLEVTYTFSSEGKELGKVRYVRTPGMLLRVDEGFILYDATKRSCSYDREKLEFRSLAVKKDGGNIGRIDTILADPFRQQDMMDTARFPLPHKDLSTEGILLEWVASGEVSPNKEDIDGHSCWRIEVADPIRAISKYIIWLDPDIGFCPRLIDFIWKDGHTGHHSFKDYTKVSNGIWFPGKLEITSVDKTEAYFLLCKVDTVRSNFQIPKDELTVKFPSGTRVSIGDSGQTFVAP